MKTKHNIGSMVNLVFVGADKSKRHCKGKVVHVNHASLCLSESGNNFIINRYTGFQVTDSKDGYYRLAKDTLITSLKVGDKVRVTIHKHRTKTTIADASVYKVTGTYIYLQVKDVAVRIIKRAGKQVDYLGGKIYTIQRKL